MVRFSLNIKTFLRYLGKQDQIWAKMFCIPKNMHSRTLMFSTHEKNKSQILLRTFACREMFVNGMLRVDETGVGWCAC